MQDRDGQFLKMARRELKNELTQMFLLLLSVGAPFLRRIVMSSFPDPEAAETYARAIRTEAVERMPELLEAFERNATAAGATVLWAADAAEANNIILDLARHRAVRYITKGKSKITEEIGLNEHLVENGVEVFETDLGEVITQLLALPPFHIVGPALNVPPEEISAVFLKKGIIQEPTLDPVALGRAVRFYLREKFRRLDMGIVGVNMAVAETGSIINVENEGNIRMTKSSPKTLIAVMSLEKVVPGMEDAAHILRILCRYCSVIKVSSYVSIDTGPKKTEELDGPEELFIIIVDNGRTAIYRDPKTRQILRCIRCGACLFSCPVYAKIGGYPYGFTYSGPMGQVLNPMLLGIENTQDLYRACTLCGSCKANCPAGVDHPSLILDYRARSVESSRSGGILGARLYGAGASAVTRAMTKGWLWRCAAESARWILNRYVEEGYIKRLPGHARGWFQCRDLRAMPGKTFHERWEAIQAGREDI